MYKGELKSMSQGQLTVYINKLIRDNQLWKFYKHPDWMELRDEVMEEHKHECLDCKKNGLHARARSVHHEQWVRHHPEFAMSKTYIFGGKEYRNLIPLCEGCHNMRHPEKGKKKQQTKGFMNEERW